MTKILAVDDEMLYRQLVKVNLMPEGYEVITAANGQEAVETTVNEKPDLIIMDVTMPELDGFEACERIRQFSDVPIIMLTGRGEEENRIKGFQMGADDYVLKPFSISELIARVGAVLRRSKNSKPAESTQRYFQHGSLKIDFARAEVFKDDRAVNLSATEYKVLSQFAQNPDRVLSAEDLLTNVWGEGYKDDKEILWVTLARLRQKLEDDPKKPNHIITQPGIGYKMPLL
ncbi:MAG TPA: response regulator transcription factor [Bellilinea sp.]|nr:response regulator transcription factor [Bellilinea sp.]